MRCTRRFLCLALLLSWAAGAQNKLPVKRVVLFKNGVPAAQLVGAAPKGKLASFIESNI